MKCLKLVLRKGLQACFITWKNKTHQKKQKDDMAHAADQMANPIFNKLNDRVTRKPLKEAFDRIKANPMPKKLKSAVRNLQNCRERENRNGFFRWKLNILSQRLRDSMDTIGKNPHIIEGVNKLNAAKNRKPRDALRMLFKELNDKKNSDVVVKRLRIFFSKGLGAHFYNWRDVNDLEKSQEKLADNSKKLMTLARPVEEKLRRRPLRTAFKKWSKPDQKPEKLKRLMIALNGHLDASLNYGFFQWRLNAINDKLNCEIKQLKPRSNIVQGVNKLDKLELKKPRKAVKAFNSNKNHRNA